MPPRPAPPPGPDMARRPVISTGQGGSGISPDTAAPASIATVAMGRVVAVFGVRGWVKVESYTRPALGLQAYRRWLLDGQPYRVRALRPQGFIFVAHLAAPGAEEPLADRDAATALVGREIHIPRTEMPPAPPGQIYWSDLIGMAVVNPAGEALGRVERIIENGVQDVLVLPTGPDTPPRLIPFVRGPVVESVDETARVILAHWEADW